VLRAEALVLTVQLLERVTAGPAHPPSLADLEGVVNEANELRLFPVRHDRITSDDYFTPRWVFDRLGIRFDLDVCAPRGGVEWIPADRHYHLGTDGLAQTWEGRVWMNPPFSRVAPWWQMFAAHGNGIALMPLVKSWVLNRIMEQAEAIAVGPAGGEMKFVRPEDPTPVRVWTPVFFAAYGTECVEALRRIGVVR
jgi:hypothetical protein